MAFQDIPPVETADNLLDIAFRRAKEKVSELKAKTKKGSMQSSRQYMAYLKEMEFIRFSVVKDTLVNKFRAVLSSFPATPDLTEFYHELIKCTLDFVFYKKSLGAVAWVVRKINGMWQIYSPKIKTADRRSIHTIRKGFYGRVSSVVKQIKKNLNYLNECRNIMRTYPTVKSDIPTIAIIGFPNVGKTTLLFKLTGSRPEIAPYSFTTKTINVAYRMEDGRKIQFLDTPGTLNRFAKMNNIEKQAYLAIKFVADKLIYIFDPSEPYPLSQQIKLLKDLEKHKKPTIIFISKTDIESNEIKENTAFLKKELADYKLITDLKELVKAIL